MQLKMAVDGDLPDKYGFLTASGYEGGSMGVNVGSVLTICIFKYAKQASKTKRFLPVFIAAINGLKHIRNGNSFYSRKTTKIRRNL